MEVNYNNFVLNIETKKYFTSWTKKLNTNKTDIKLRSKENLSTDLMQETTIHVTLFT